MDSAESILQEYEYRPLDADAQEIRLIRLLPGTFDDELVVEIFHTPFVEPEPAKDIRLDLREIRKTLRTPWEVHETHERRYLYYDASEKISRWTHPDVDVDGELYGNGKSFETPLLLNPHAEFPTALSYVWGTEEADLKVKVVHNNPTGIPSIIYVKPNLHNALKYLRDSQIERVLWIDAICINQSDIGERNHEVAKMAQIYTLASRTVIWLGLEDASGSSKRAFAILGFIGEQFEYTTAGLVQVSPGFENRSATNTAFPSAYVHPRSLLAVSRAVENDVGPIYSEADFEAIQQILTRPWWDRLWIWQEAALGYRKAIAQCGTDTVPWPLFAHSACFITLHGKRTFGASYDSLLVLQRAGLFPEPHKVSTLGKKLWATHEAQYKDKHDRIYALLGLASPRYRAHISIDYSMDVFDMFYDTCVAIVTVEGRLSFLNFCNLNQEAQHTRPTWVPDWNFNGLKILESTLASGRAVSTHVGAIDGPELTVQSTICGKVQYVAALDRDEFLSMDEVLSQNDANRVIAYDYHKGRSVFVPDQGQLGLGPPSVLPGDHIAVIFGAQFPMIVRPSNLNASSQAPRYRVVGPAFMQDLADAQALRGPIPSHYQTFHYHRIFENRVMKEWSWFRNIVTEKVTPEDPRLGEISEDWELGSGFRERELRWYRNKITGQISFDPRDEPDEVRKRGIDVKDIVLI
ncbi:hypothetical protein P171DRAFT_522385 [Karstenula rhodostoma CBS 690.94]|uniref:WW domain-containing protein n=1 Tax=Karstenula rhodostoma CBS 690.94 TaxID=1392251 RepID=A0A9P4UB14_9PLEO|nr:hypothetical protein P171DRAFT_522385 [Karstenula rhodostoma CBS 690.94]